MTSMEISDIRRAKLKQWFEKRAIPPKEKSYLSQLMTGTASFGERAARRLERDYGMDKGYLDGGEAQSGQDTERDVSHITLVEPKVNAEPEDMSLMWVTGKGRELLTEFYSTDKDGQESILRAAKAVQKVMRPTAVTNKP
jgi:hypothetical protein